MEGTETIAQTENELTEIRGRIGTGNTNNRHTAGRTAFTRGFTPIQRGAIDSSSGRIIAEIKTDGTISTSTSNEGINGYVSGGESITSGSLDTDRTNAYVDTGNAGRSTSLEDGSVGVGRSVETPRKRGRPFGSTTVNKLNSEREEVGYVGISQGEHSLTGVSITVENTAIEDEPESEPKEKKARIKKPKEPPAGKVGEVSSSLKDIYQIIDMVAEAGIKFLGKGDNYPKDLMCLDDDVANRLARNLVQLNDAMPKLAAKFNTVSVPVMLISTLATDLFGKGVIIYGIVKSPKPS